MPPARILALTMAALTGFAANSLLCRAALRPGLVDAATFTTIRIVSGALALALLVRGLRGFAARRGGELVVGGRETRAWPRAFALFAYAAAFSFAYRRLEVAAGALLLFGAVQATMMVAALWGGERLRGLALVGFALALAGLAALTLPGLATPDPVGAALMLAAGVAWGLYSLWGRGVTQPVRRTASSFARATPLALAVSLLALPDMHATGMGIALAVASGAVASGMGYALWYAALPGLRVTQAAIVQLSVPVVTAVAGIILLDERPTAGLALAGAAILGGIVLTLIATPRRAASGEGLLGTPPSRQ